MTGAVQLVRRMLSTAGHADFSDCHSVLLQLDVPAHVFAATAPSKAEDSFRKPAPGMWTFFKAKCSAGQAIGTAVGCVTS